MDCTAGNTTAENAGMGGTVMTHADTDTLSPDLLQGPILLFDGVCNLCQASVQFVLKRDARRAFRFASLQSPIGVELAARFAVDADCLSSVVLILDGNAYTRSTAALRTVKLLRTPWPAMGIFLIVPKFIRDAVYDFIGDRRYRWFGKMDVCWVPDDDIKQRFID